MKAKLVGPVHRNSRTVSGQVRFSDRSVFWFAWVPGQQSLYLQEDQFSYYFVPGQARQSALLHALRERGYAGHAIADTGPGESAAGTGARGR